ncbi:MAG: alpha/beta hydrolase [Pigmentiphaga sp.]|uniref:alpha/beta hydrolase n=1 Tax=Pigmentiphaga sp. TaxID=1977564 RepID=UPI0029A444A3|nr:alpha/beta hydrolase [Pigmentiphaga sp.]MDX3905907.1 alpha/beta hydrolase [Pigmentiphaga sp.]
MKTAVYGDYDQEELDRQYDNQRYCPTFRETLDEGARLSLEASPLCTERDVRWGEHPDARLDIYRPAGPGPYPVVVYVHGGAWLGQSKEESAFAAPAFVEDQCMYVALGFPRASQVPFADMVAAVREGIGWIVRNIARFGGDPRRIVLIGHSSGSHLVSQCLIHDWKAAGLPGNDFAGAVLVSGLGDLEPVRLSYRNQRLHLTPAQVNEFSLLRNEPSGRTPVVVAVARGDTDEFRRQSGEVARYWRARGLLASEHVFEDRHHFDVILDLCNRSSALYRAVMELAGGDGIRST